MEPEYRTDEQTKMKREPGIPDEMVAELAAEPVEPIAFNRELASEASPLLVSALLAIVLTEAIKPWAKLALDARNVSDDGTKRLIQTLPFLFGVATSATFGFREMVLDLTGVAISVLEAAAYGGASVGVLALVIYEFIHTVRPIKVLRLRFYRFAGVTEDEVAAPTVRKVPPIDPDKLK